MGNFIVLVAQKNMNTYFGGDMYSRKQSSQTKMSEYEGTALGESAQGTNGRREGADPVEIIWKM